MGDDSTNTNDNIDMENIMDSFMKIIKDADLDTKRIMQGKLFNEIKLQEKSCNPTILPDDKTVDNYTTYKPSFLSKGKDDVLLAGLDADIERLGLTGKRIKSDKVQTKWVGQSFIKKPNEYPFDNYDSVVECTPLSEVPFVQQLIDTVNGPDRCQSKKAAHAIITYYPASASSLRSHADDESYLDQSCPISTFSLGGPRGMVLSSKNTKLKVKSYVLENCSLLVMESGCQNFFLHRINQGDGSRISISIRRIKDEALVDVNSSQCSDASNDLFLNKVSEPKKSVWNRTTVILGDSIDAELIPSRLHKGNNINVINLSKGGNKISDILDTIDDIPLQGVKVVDRAIISVGINDIRNCRGKVQHFKEAYINLIHKLKLMFPNISIYVRCILPVKIVNEFTVTNIIKFNKLLLHICKTEHCYFINIFRDFLNPDGRFRNMTLYRNDVHLKQRGTGIIARKYIFIINKNTFNPYIG